MSTTKDKKPKIDDDFLAGLKKADNTKDKTTNFETRQDRRSVEPAKGRKGRKPADPGDKKVLCNFNINESLLQELRNYCEENYMTLTAGIIKAITNMLKEGK